MLEQLPTGGIYDIARVGQRRLLQCSGAELPTVLTSQRGGVLDVP